MKVVYGLLVLMLALAVAAGVQATEPGPFDARVVVEDESDEQRRAGAREGLLQVLERLTGRSDIRTDPGVEALLQNADRYVQQFDYGGETEEDGESRRLLRLRFDGGAVERELSQRGIALWPMEDRPQTLVWLAVERDGRRELIGGDPGDSGDAIQRAMHRAAAESGLRITLPLMDLEDQRAMDSSDLWGGFREPILEASERYDPEAVLVGRLSRGRDGGWDGRWLLFWQGETREIQVSEGDPAAVMAAASSRVTAHMGSRMGTVAVGAEGTGVLRVRIQGIGSLADFAWAERTVSRTRGVFRVAADGVDGDSVDFLVQTSLDPERLGNTLGNEGRLSAGEPSRDADGPELVFRLR